MPSFSNIDGEESATVTFRVGTVQVARGSTNEEQEILCLGDPDTSNAIAAVTASAPASTRWALNTRIVSGPSSVADLSVRAVLPSTATDNPVSAAQASTVWAIQADGRIRAQNSSAADFLATISGNSTAVIASGNSSVIVTAGNSSVIITAGNSSVLAAQASTVWAVQVDGRVRAQNSTIGDLLASVQQNSTVWAIQADGRVRAQNSTIGDLLASVQQNSTVWQTQAKIQDSSAVGFVGTTTRPTTGAQGLVTRECLNDLQSTGLSTVGNNSTRQSIVSSVAGQRIKVYAYTITSTAQAINSVGWWSSAANLLWPIILQAQSSAITGANLAVTPPAWLFATASAEALNFGVTGTTGTYNVGVSYFVEA